MGWLIVLLAVVIVAAWLDKRIEPSIDQVLMHSEADYRDERYGGMQ